MSFEQISYLAQIVASIGVVVSLIFVGLQIFPKGDVRSDGGDAPRRITQNSARRDLVA